MYDKRKLTILRAALIAIGAAVGGTAMWQYFEFFPVMRRELQIVVIAVSSAALAAALGLSAKPFYRLGASIGETFIKLAGDLGYRGVTAVASGLVSSVAVGYLFDFAVRGGVKITAVRVILDVLVAALAAAVFCYGFIRWIASDEQEAPPSDYSGYLITASCFLDDRVYTAVEFMLRPKITTSAIEAVFEFGDNAALARLKTVADSGFCDIVRRNDRFSTAAEYVRTDGATAVAKNLRAVAFECSALPAMPDAAKLEVFVADAEAQMRLKDAAKSENADDARTGTRSDDPLGAESAKSGKDGDDKVSGGSDGGQSEEGGAPSGGIIIDK